MKGDKELNRLFKSLTPEVLEEMKQERIEEKNKLTSEWQLGYYVGNYIVYRYLPSISVENDTRNVISMSSEDETEYKKTDEDWFNKRSLGKEANEEWVIFQECRKKLLKKYLPNPLQCHLGLLNITNMEEFKDGIMTSLWDSDVCNYNIDPDNIKIYDDDDMYFTIIELGLDKDDGIKK